MAQKTKTKNAPDGAFLGDARRGNAAPLTGKAKADIASASARDREARRAKRLKPEGEATAKTAGRAKPAAKD